ncbi:HNH endonuclease [Thalassobacillus pellis]|uniref:HNH endonuclease n=1 Tax=Thalassobacillus pellis TaxID=748008 RepID=UPI00196064CF|nr:HNH endonuclease [Thalassobacillus pellis]MBM7554899.1 hypothetical protein [Thalassobacillus pellis]
MNWFTVPIGNEYKKIEKSISNMVRIEDIEHLLDGDEINRLSQHGYSERVNIWGTANRDTKRNEWKWMKMKPGDKVLLFADNTYTFIGTVLFKTRNRDLGKAIWTEESGVFEFIYFLGDVERISMSCDDFNPVIGYTSAPRSFNMISKRRITNAESQYGSVEAAIRSITGKEVSEEAYSQIISEEVEDDVKYQREIEKATPNPPSEDVPKELHEVSTYHSRTGNYSRDAGEALRALIDGGFQCEVDPLHETFLNKTTMTHFVEAHHLVPLSQQKNYSYSVDVKANIIALCPNCHRKIHHARLVEKREMIEDLYKERKARLKNAGIMTSIEELLTYY